MLFPSPHRWIKRMSRGFISVVTALITLATNQSLTGQTVYVSRMWHNHQPIYWPEWNGNGSQTSRIQYAWDSIVLKNGQTYGTGTGHPDNDLNAIFSVADRVAAYQGRPKTSLGKLKDNDGNPYNEAGFCMSYSGSLIDNIRSLSLANSGQGALGYGSGWASGNRDARGWTTPSGSRRMDLVGFTYHHALGPLLPKSVFRKELQIFRQAWWKAWGGNSNLSDHSKGFFPTEMAFSESMIDVLTESDDQFSGYQWAIVASHHLSRTCPTYFDHANPTGNFNIKSSPPNKADLLGPSPTSGWWFSEPNPGNAAWNVSPHAYQLHRAKYVNPETGAEKSIILVPSDDVLSYVAGYSGAQVGMVKANIASQATDPSRPVVVLASTDGDNAWGGGYDSWEVSTPNFFRDCKTEGYALTSIQDLVNSKPPPAGTYAHVEDGAWIFPESDYGSPYFLKWIEPPLGTGGSATAYPGTKADLETPGFALKFWSWAPVITGANWCETAEQMLLDEGGSVAPWKIQAPYDWDGSTWNPAPNDVELAWHIYLGGLDSGFNYYGGLGNDDEVKQSLATSRAIEKLSNFVNSRLTANPSKDHTPPTVLRPQRFPWNPGSYTFGWFNSYGSGANANYLKKMPSDFYIWTHAYDVSGIASVNAKVRISNTGVNSMSDNQNETYSGGPNVGFWTSIAMTKRVLPNTRAALNAAANNGQIDYFITPPVLADYYFVKINNTNVPGFRGKLLDYYIEATDARGNISKSDIQHVFVEDDGAISTAPAKPTGLTANTTSSTTISLTWNSSADAASYIIQRNSTQIGTSSTASYNDAGLAPSTPYTYTVIAHNSAGDSPASDPASATTFAPPTIPSTPTGLSDIPAATKQINLCWNSVSGATSYILKRNGTQVATPTSNVFYDTGLTASTAYSYTVAATNSAGTSADSPSVTAGTLGADISFVMDGTADSPGYLVNTPGATMTLYAALRGSRLYVATWSPGSSGGANDHFIIITDQVLSSASEPAFWGKPGKMAVAFNKPFLAGESSNSFVGLSNAGPSVQSFKSATSSNGEKMEGTFDLIEAFGAIPQTIYIAAVAYGTADSGALIAQAPAGNGDGNLDPNEFLAISLPAFSLLDRNADGKFDRLDSAMDFKSQISCNTNGTPVIAWPCVPGRSYQVDYCNDLGATWFTFGSPVSATSGQLILSTSDSTLQSRRFYRVRLLSP